MCVYIYIYIHTEMNFRDESNLVWLNRLKVFTNDRSWISSVDLTDAEVVPDRIGDRFLPEQGMQQKCMSLQARSQGDMRAGSKTTCKVLSQVHGLEPCTPLVRSSSVDEAPFRKFPAGYFLTAVSVSSNRLWDSTVTAPHYRGLVCSGLATSSRGMPRRVVLGGVELHQPSQAVPEVPEHLRLLKQATECKRDAQATECWVRKPSKGIGSLR